MANEKFSSTFDAATAIFPGALNLSGLRSSETRGQTTQNSKVPPLLKALFSCEANFEGANFEDTASFAGICCHGSAQFRNVTFQKAISFEQANFAKDAWFRGSHFRGVTNFRKARFMGEAGLGACNYDSSTDFSTVRFRDNAGFDGACFEADVNFNDTRFERNAWFSKAIFHGSATFERASFLGRMHFDAIKIAPPNSSAARQLEELIRLAMTRSGK